jgi:hypothetical protein
MIFSSYRSGLSFPVSIEPSSVGDHVCKRSSGTFLKHFLNMVGTKEIILGTTMERRVHMSNHGFSWQRSGPDNSR